MAKDNIYIFLKEIKFFYTKLTRILLFLVEHYNTKIYIIRH